MSYIDTDIMPEQPKVIDWSKYKMRCSALYVLFTEPKSVEDKKNGELSGTAKEFLNKVYIQEKWGRRKEVMTKQMKKGILVEDGIIDILGFKSNKPYKKNTERKSNDWIEGCCDIDYEPDDEVTDVKASWEPESFIQVLVNKINPIYDYQLQGYMWLWKRLRGKLAYILEDCPDMILQNELRSLLYRMDVATDENPEYKVAAAKLIRELTFSDIPIEERIIEIPVARNEDIIKQIPAKVGKAREYLAYLESVHLKQIRK
jgi:hypothetical protein